MDIVQEVLKREQEALSKFKPITVEKHLTVENDLGHLLCIDPNDLDDNQIKFVFPKIDLFSGLIVNLYRVSGQIRKSICLHLLGTTHSYY